MKRWRALVLIFALLSLCVGIRPAYAYYDDVHYGLTYFVARAVGYTPEQAYRLASVCVEVDNASNETEPVQLSGILQALLPLVAKSPDLEAASRDPTVQKAAESQWRFHAFRDLGRFPHSFGNGPDAAAADAAIAKQEGVLWDEAQALRNPGIFLHFFQDEVPHGAYTSPGGHWVLPAEGKGSAFPVGGTTDWLSYRDPAANMKLANETAYRLISHVQACSKYQRGRQRPDFDTLLSGLMGGMNRVNEAPTSLKGLGEVIAAKGVMALTKPGPVAADPKLPPELKDVRLRKHAHGPLFPEAMRVVSDAVSRAGMFERVIPPRPRHYTIRKRPGSTGAFIAERDESVLWGDLHVFLKTTDIDKLTIPKDLEVTVKFNPTQKDEEPYVLDTTPGAPSEAVWTGAKPYNFLDMPIGQVTVEVKRDGKLVAKKEDVELLKQQTDITINLGPKRSVVFLVDTSGSMQGPKIEEARKAVAALIAKSAPTGEEQWAILGFSNHNVREILPFTTDAAQAQEAVKELAPGGDTPLRYGEAKATAYLLAADTEEGRLIILCDGDDNCPGPTHAAGGQDDRPAAKKAQDRLLQVFKDLKPKGGRP